MITSSLYIKSGKIQSFKSLSEQILCDNRFNDSTIKARYIGDEMSQRSASILLCELQRNSNRLGNTQLNNR